MSISTPTKTSQPAWLMLACVFTACPTAFAQFDAKASVGTPEFLNNDAIRDAGNDQQPSIATDGQGNWVAVWQTDRQAGTGGDISVEVRWAVSSDAGKTWSEPASLLTDARRNGQDDTTPALATDRKGNWVLMWISPDSGSTQHNGTDSDVLTVHSTNNGQTWSEPRRIETPPQDVATGSDPSADFDLTLATDGDTWIALWSSTRDIGGGGGSHPPNDAVLLTAQSFDGGVTWSSAGSFTRFDGAGDFAPTLAADGSGRWMALWASDGALVYSESIDDGLTFSEPTELANSAGGANPKVACNTTYQSARNRSESQWMVAYAKGGEVQVSNSMNTDASATGVDRNWTAPTFVGSGVNPYLAAGMDGSWLVGWEQVGLFGDDIDILVSQSRNGGSTWDDPAPLDANANSDEAEDLGVQLATDGEGSWLAIWYSGNQAKGAGNDEDLFAMPFAFAADCDGDGVGDPQQARMGDCDEDGVPDACDDSACSANGSNNAGSGSSSSGGSVGCGAGAVGMVPLMMLALGSISAGRRRDLRA